MRETEWGMNRSYFFFFWEENIPEPILLLLLIKDLLSCFNDIINLVL